MSDHPITRRNLMSQAGGLAAWAALAGTPVARAVASPPYPTMPEGRYTPAALEAYERNMLSGGPPKDGIPAIDAPNFWSATEADAYLDGADVVFGLVANGVARAYPQRILVWHEIVNDDVGGLPLAVTYCPLTGTAIAFESGGTEFGVTGRLVNSNLVMYDRDTDTWFPQVLAVGIIGPHAGAALVERPMVWTTWERWRAHPQTEVLSTDTGFARNYQRDPYGSYNPLSGYYQPDSFTMFPLMHQDRSRPAKSVLLGARTQSAAIAFPLGDLREAGRLELAGARRPSPPSMTPHSTLATFSAAARTRRRRSTGPGRKAFPGRAARRRSRSMPSRRCGSPGWPSIRRARSMRDVLRRLVASRANLGLALGIAAAYLALFLVAVADLTIDGAARSASLFLVAGWENLVFRQQAPFQFEAVAIAEAPGLVWLVSPMNVLIGLALGLVTGLQMALVRIARSSAVACGVSPAAGLLAGLPGLLAGSACCVPILFLLLGVQPR